MKIEELLPQHTDTTSATAVSPIANSDILLIFTYTYRGDIPVNGHLSQY